MGKIILLRSDANLENFISQTPHTRKGGGLTRMKGLPWGIMRMICCHVPMVARPSANTRKGMRRYVYGKPLRVWGVLKEVLGRKWYLAIRVMDWSYI